MSATTPVPLTLDPQRCSYLMSMDASLEGVKLKIARAAEHLEELSKEVKDYLDSQPYEVVAEARQEDNPLLVCKVHRQPPLRLSLLLGDFLHNLRSSLDHLAWQLVLASDGTPETLTSFPIYARRRKYKEFKKKNDTASGVVGEISEKAARLVEKAQPYNNEDGTPPEDLLWILNKLNNIDKHGQLNISVLNATDVVQVDLLTADGTGIYATIQFPEAVQENKPMEDGATVGVDPFLKAPHLQTRVLLISTVALYETGEVGPFGTRSVGTVARELLDHVGNTMVPKFEKFFFPPPQIPLSGGSVSASSSISNRWRFIAASRRWRASW